MEFVHQLGSVIHDRAYDEIIYIDETTFNLWQKLSRCWVTTGMKLSLIKTRGPSITVIGAISKERGLVYFEVFVESNNSNLFLNFMQALKNKCEGRRVVVVLDNLRIYHSKKLNEVYDNDFKELFLPTYSSELNPIERLWSIVKRKWTQNLHLFVDEMSLALTKKVKKKQELLTRSTIERLRETISKYIERFKD